MRQTKAAFHWIVGILRKHKIPFQISGGLAARVYGATRPLADIDIEVPDDALGRLLDDVRAYTTFGPARYKDKQWDLSLLTIKYKGQEIDLCGKDTLRLFDKRTSRWIADRADLSLAARRRVFGLIVPVTPKASLIAYKQRIRRAVDIEDLRALGAMP